MEKNIGKAEKVGNYINYGLKCLCEFVGAKMAREACKILIPEAGFFTKLGAGLIGSGIGDLATEKMRQEIDEACKKMDNGAADSEEKKPEEQTSEEIVEAE